MNKIGDRLDQARKEIGLTYKEIGAILGITESGARLSIKRNTVKPKHINSICKKTLINKEWLLNGQEPMIIDSNDIDIHSMSIDDILTLNLDKEVIKLVKFLIKNNANLLKNPVYRDFVKGNIESLELIEKKEETQKKIEKINQIMLEKLLKEEAGNQNQK